GLDMLRLVMACKYTRGMAVHCHNQAVHCLAGVHERSKRGALVQDGEVAENSFQDCRSTIKDCLDVIVYNRVENIEPECTNLARDMSKSANTYVKLLSDVHGQSAIDVYEVISGRLLSQCPRSTVAVNKCLLSFHECAVDNQHTSPLVDTTRKIKIECHRILTYCIEQATVYENSV
ncbi:hypothetical protein PFISCL1PPCAC_23400, partial [Pristionchus fissidentatus]